MVYQTDEKTNDVMVMLQNKDIEIASLRNKVKELDTDNDVCHRVSVETEGIITGLRKRVKEEYNIGVDDCISIINTKFF